jgi:uncharacterized protein DUF2877
MAAVAAVGWRAHAALTASAGLATVVAPLSASVYADAAGELIWIGRPGVALHPRTVLVQDSGPSPTRTSVSTARDGIAHRRRGGPSMQARGARVRSTVNGMGERLGEERSIPPPGASIRVTVDGVAPWRPTPAGAPLAGVSAGAGALHEALAALGDPRGLGRLLVSGVAGDPVPGHARRAAGTRTGEAWRAGDDLVLARARPHALRLALACAAGDDPGALADAARPLLGLGEGLTPSGDDYVGGVMFAQRVVAGGGVTADAAARIVADAGALTHPISARLLADLAAGEGWAPLHDLLVALGGARPDAVLAAARRVIALGHTSGWSLLAGMLTAILGPSALA